MAELIDYHKLCRDAVKEALAEASPDMPQGWHAIDEIDDATKLTRPCGAVCCVGPEQDRPEFGTNQRDGIGYPVAVLLLGTGKSHGEKRTGPTDLTGFRRLVKVLFHSKRLAGVDQVALCEVTDSGPLVDEKAPLFNLLQTALVVTCVGRFPRG